MSDKKKDKKGGEPAGTQGGKKNQKIHRRGNLEKSVAGPTKDLWQKILEKRGQRPLN